MTKSADLISAKIVIILIVFSLATIFGCKGDNWGFDLFGGDPINEDGDDSGGGDDNNGDDGDDNGNNGNGISAEFPPSVFSANIGGTKINEPVELFSSLIMEPISQRLRV